MAQPASDASTPQPHLASLQQLLQCPGEYARSTPLQLAPSADGTAAPTLSLVSFNILARLYCDGARRFATHPTPEFLEWSWRRTRIQEILQAADADVVCCQELVPSEFESQELRQAKLEREAQRLAAIQAKEALARAKKEEMQKKAEKKAAAAAAKKNANKDANAAAPAAESASSASPAPPATDAAAAAASPAPAADSAAASSASSESAAAPASSAAASASASASASAGGEDDNDDCVSSTASANYVPPAEGDFSTWLSTRGYAYELQQDQSKTVVVGVFWKTSRFYARPVLVDSRSRAIIVALKLRAADGEEEPAASLDNTVFVCNVHLQGHFDEVSMRLNQVKSMFKQLEKHVTQLTPKTKAAPAAKKGAAPAAPAADAAALAAASAASAASASADAAAPAAAAPASPMIMFTGDFNQNFEHSSVHRLAVDGVVPAGFVDATVRRVVTAEAVTQPFRMQSAYDRERRPKQFWPQYTFHNNHNPASPSYTNVIDYVYHSPATLPLLATMRVLGNQDELQVIDRTSLPNELIPSDHLPIGATFYCPALGKKRART